MLLYNFQTLPSMLANVNYTGDTKVPGVENLVLVQIKEGCYCWRFKNKYVLFDIGDIEEDGVGDYVKKLRDEGVGIAEVMKRGGPPQEVVVTIMSRLSPSYKVLISENLNNLLLLSLHKHCDNFIKCMPHIYRAYKTGLLVNKDHSFFDIPFIKDIVIRYVDRFFTEMKNIVSNVGDENNVVVKYYKIIMDKELKNNNNPFNEFKRACSASIPAIIKNMDRITSIVFSTCYLSLTELLGICVKCLDNKDFSVFRQIVLGSGDLRVAPPTFVQNISPIKQKRPKIKKIPKRTWRDKRPPPIDTNLEVNMKYWKPDRHAVRRSVRIAKLKPRRSMRLKSRNQDI